MTDVPTSPSGSFPTPGPPGPAGPPGPPASRSLWRRLRRFLAPALLVAVFVLIFTMFGAVLVPFILALIIVYLIEPVVKRMHRVQVGRWRLPRWVAVIVVYLCFFGVVSLSTLLIVPPLARELSRLASEAPQFFEEVRREHLPTLNREIQQIIDRVFPAKLSDYQVAEAREAIYDATDRAHSLSALVAALTAEELELFSMGAADVVIEEPNGSHDGVGAALRIRPDPDTGDWLVYLQDVELVSDPARGGAYLLRSHAEVEQQPERGIAFDLEARLDEALGDLAERSGEGVSELISVGQGLAVGILSAFVGIVLTFMIAAFTSIDLPKIMDYFRNTVPEASRRTYDDLLKQLDRGLSGVVRGQLMICVVNGVLTAIGLLLFEVKFALVLALFATVLSLIPIFGTIISTIPAVGMALATDGLTTGLLVLGWILMIHFIEANILNPKIIGTQAHIHPVIVVFALLAGEHSYGLMGALLAVPVASIFLTLFKFVLNRSMERARAPEEAAP